MPVAFSGRFAQEKLEGGLPDSTVGFGFRLFFGSLTHVSNIDGIVYRRIDAGHSKFRADPRSSIACARVAPTDPLSLRAPPQVPPKPTPMAFVRGGAGIVVRFIVPSRVFGPWYNRYHRYNSTNTRRGQNFRTGYLMPMNIATCYLGPNALRPGPHHNHLPRVSAAPPAPGFATGQAHL